MRLIESWNTRELRRRYKESFGVDISRFLKSDELRLVEDVELGIQFFEGCDPGDAAFYSILSRQPWYYTKEKWEHSTALEWLSRLDRDASVLEIGCGGGEFLLPAKNAGFNDLTGTEFNPEALETCKQYGLRVASHSTSDLVEDGKRFDFIAAFQVLEHVPDPTRFLSDVSRLLADNGVAIISTPNRETFTKKLDWNLLDMPPHHLTRWSIDALRKAGEKSGLAFSSVRFEPLASYHQGMFVSSLLQWVPETLHLRPVAERLAGLVRLPEAVRKKIKGHTLLCTFGRADPS